MTDKYINKKWIDTKMKYDPLYLFENKKEKFDRWLRKRLGAAPVEDEPAKPTQKQPKQPVSAPVPKAAPVQAKMPEIFDLINMNSQEDTFEDFQSATSVPSAPSNFDSLLNLYNPQPSAASAANGEQSF